MQNSARYWIWLAGALGYGNSKVKTVMRFYSSIEDFYNKGYEEWLLCGCFSKKELNGLSTYTLEQADSIIEKAQNLNQNIITIEDNSYPQLLKEIFNPPAVIYTKGDISKLSNALCIGIVGTRNATSEGIKTAFNFGYDLSKAGVAVISGGALGVDSAAHKGVIQANGVTACVLGCGINYNYLMTNVQLRNAVAVNGVIISEYPPNSPATNWNFPMRNRIIAGLSKGVLVIEAGQKSGSLITAKLALEENRDVFAIPGSLSNSQSIGTNNLIKMGAIPVTDFQDILTEYQGVYTAPCTAVKTHDLNSTGITYEKHNTTNINNQKSKTTEETSQIKTNAKLLPTGLSKNAETVYNAMKNEPTNVDTIIINSGLQVNHVLSALTELEFMGLIEALPGARYKAL